MRIISETPTVRACDSLSVLDAALGEILTTCEKLRWLIAYGEHSLKPENRPYVHLQPLNTPQLICGKVLHGCSLTKVRLAP